MKWDGYSPAKRGVGNRRRGQAELYQARLHEKHLKFLLGELMLKYEFLGWGENAVYSKDLVERKSFRAWY